MDLPACIATQIPVCLILEKPGTGESADQILHGLPSAPDGTHINAALQYAAALARHEVALAS